MKNKTMLFVLLAWSSTTAGDSITSSRTSIVIEGMAVTQYKSPMLGIMCEKIYTDRKTGINFIVKVGYWHNPFVKKSNFLIVQSGASFPIKKTELGFYFMNFNGFLPRPEYATPAEAKNEGYNSPFSLFLTTYPFHNKKVSVTSEISYFTNLAKFGFRVSCNYRLFNHQKL